MYILKISALFLFLLQNSDGQAIGDACDEGRGECKKFLDCSSVVVKLHTLNINEINFCNRATSVVCCEKLKTKPVIDKSAAKPLREAEKACNEFRNYASKTCSQALIVGGQEADAKEYPHMALIGIRSDDGHLDWKCGGTLISSKFVLTAAHCLEVDLNYVRLGELDFNSHTDDEKLQDFTIENSIIHPNYTFEKYNDVALVELNRTATFDDYVIPACLATTSGNEFQEFTVAGWGAVAAAEGLSSHLRKVHLERFNDADCKDIVQTYGFDDELIKGVDPRTQLCAGSHTKNYDTCQGDSGGPLFVNHPEFDCLFTVVGVTSFGSAVCGSAGNPGVYVRVFLFLDWIENIVWNAIVW